MNYFISYLVAVNLITFIFFWNDKRRSKKEAWRISEKTLIGLCLVGGSIGGFLGMRVFHHKTKHFLFAWGIPIILILQIGLGLLFFFKVLN
ncbi:DUF1294 domain-containing protein [Acetobacterium malicum]|uniref:DUF1294 domain-containing protein n=1 Tax=Acetobacterium malicum TaxID=52692 RepID=A0ABR6YYK2_9FIRM|nr:DUF1294 domain-containing protein [Acetobacterium malicum]MBC3900179.1 DUF1294 domain-containing protein [Acetobacterium malicum]